jgi:hypothetical protein
MSKQAFNSRLTTPKQGLGIWLCLLVVGIFSPAGTGIVSASEQHHLRPHGEAPIHPDVARAIRHEPSSSRSVSRDPGSYLEGATSAWTQRDKLTASNGTTGVVDHFGWDVALRGDTALVLACEAAGGSSAFVYERTDNVWTEQAILTPVDQGRGCWSFYQGSVDFDGDTAALGMPLDQASSLGSAYIYTLLQDQWTLEAELVSKDPIGVDFFGSSIALDEDTVLVGAPFGQAAYIFTRANGVWTEQVRLTSSSNPGQDSAFGWSVALQGDTAVVGDLGDSGASLPPSVHIFSRKNNSWLLQTTLNPPDLVDNLDFGYSLDLDGDTLAIGASGLTLNGQASVYVFVRDGLQWVEQARLMQPQTQPAGNIGRALALQGDILLVGDEESRAVYAYERAGSDWNLTDEIVTADSDNLRFGRAVAIDQDTAVISNFPVNFTGQGSNGSAFVFDTEDLQEPYGDVGVGINAVRNFLRPGQIQDYLVTVYNSGTASVAGAEVASSIAPELDIDFAQWQCLAPANSGCTESGSGNIVDGGLALPAGGSVSYLLSAPVRLGSGGVMETAVYGTHADDPNPKNDIATTNTQLVLFRNGLELYSHASALEGALSTTLTLRPNGLATITLPTQGDSVVGPLVAGFSDVADTGGLEVFRLEHATAGASQWLRLVAHDENGLERATDWTLTTTTVGEAKIVLEDAGWATPESAMSQSRLEVRVLVGGNELRMPLMTSHSTIRLRTAVPVSAE